MKLNPLSDNELMLKVKSGEIARLGLLFERYHKPLFGFFYRSTRQAEISEDLVQNVFEKILKSRKLFRGDGKFSTWMYTIARNEMVDHFKRSKRMPELSQIEVEQQEGETEPGYFEVEQKKEELKLLQFAFGKLEDEQQQLITLSKYQGLSYREVGEVMKVSEGNARIKVFRAMQNLKTIYRKIEKQVLS